MPSPQVTIIVVPRERFSYAQASLESIFADTTEPFNLVYVDGNSPPVLQQYLEKQARTLNFELIRREYYLSPNHARNIGLEQVKTPYLVFMDNDVIVSKGWLRHLLQCAQDTDAAVVGPLMCQDEPVHETVHFAGGESHIWIDKLGRRRLKEKMCHQGRAVTHIQSQLTRQPTELAEFHCVLVKTEIFQAIGSLDEDFWNTKEHLDFCMTVAQAGFSIYLEPSAIVTYVPGPPQAWSDITFYMLRWSDAWTLKSLQHLRVKWNLAEDGYFQTKYKKLGWRRRVTLINPFCRRFLLGLNNPFFEAGISRIERVLNHFMTLQYAKQLSKVRR